MSARQLRNVIPRREHKERHQPAHRAKLGLLEKKKDYKERAIEHHRKRDALALLRRKAAFRNEDEFYHKMIRARKVNGEFRTVEGEKHTPEQLLEMKRQDQGYIDLKHGIESKKVEKLQEGLQLTEHSSQRRHTIFVDDKESLDTFDPIEYFDTTKEFLKRSYNRPLRTSLSDQSLIVNEHEVDPEVIDHLDTKRAHSYRELNMRMQREEELKKVSQALFVQKQVMKDKKNAKKLNTKIPGKGPLYVWKKERKR
uniref:U3 small nucleolar RNA-associated protein 11 n=1 Tax=Arcella intermedia TaxID=1963864 RepID=A0A6B2LFL6_9EUKA|eukprot:TRINITY_DN24985_c0_g1_i1.p1 TRINITY_DN24985_c0_g1~~TRINITY_DN24985_c0_g1_i1.p1  ORF type:complete len:270 (+),score=76.97 TRINITY_DN24985_c0_g1_i1:50-811(+)